jgi:adenylate kinase
MLRDAVARGTELGKKAEAIMAAGDLVPDDLVVAIVEERLAATDAACGYLLDGFPRNVEQAEALASAVGDDAVEAVISLEVPEDEVVSRLLSRARVEGRSDDNEDTIRRRLEVYGQETQPLLDHYRSLLIPVEGLGSVEEVFSRIVLTLAAT